jgi:hypothetical protein
MGSSINLRLSTASPRQIDSHGRTAYLERFIHSEIYKAHPEVRAVVVFP